MARINTEAWVAFLDIYGFKSILKDTDKFIDELSKKIIASHKEVSKILSKINSPAELFVFSDSMFLAYPVNSADNEDKKNKFRWCVEDTAKVLDIFSKKKLPLRGGIAYGNACLKKNLLIGEAVVRAVHYEESVPCPAVFLPKKELRLCFGDSIPTHKLNFNDIKLKQGGITKATLIFPNPVDAFFSLIVEKYKKHIIDGPPVIAQTWKEALDYINEYKSKLKE